MATQVAFLRWKPIKILTLSRHVLAIIRYVALFYVVHVIHWLLKYVSSIMINVAKFEECDLFNPVLRKTPGIWSFAVGQNVEKLCWDLIATIIPIFLKERISYFQICYTKWPCASVAPYLRKCGNLPIRESLVITWPYVRPSVRTTGMPM